MGKLNVVLDWFANTNHTGFLLAEKRGYFAEAGLEVHIDGEVHGVMDLHGADFVLGPQISMLDCMSRGVELTGVAVLTQRSDSGIVSLKESGITAFFTRSSAANIPVNMELCEKLELDEDCYSVSIPLGSTINMAGASVTITVMALAAVHTLGISVDIPTAIILSVLAAASACGASGVAGGSLLLIPLACSLFGIPNDVAMQVVGVGFIIGVVQDSCETALNSSSDVLFAAAAEYRKWRLEGREITYGKK